LKQLGILGGRKIWSAEGWFKKFWDDYLIG
jgi:hypothetical protein